MMSKYKRLCPCQEGKDYLGVASLVPKCSRVSNEQDKKLQKIQKEFFMGNGINLKDPNEASKHLLKRDHEDLSTLHVDYKNGKLGPKFLPPIFFSEVPKVINFKEYEDFYRNKGTKGQFSDRVKGAVAEKFVFYELKKFYDGTKDDVLVIHSHRFLDVDSKEKDFVIVNLSKGYIFVIEVKANAKKFKNAERQLKHAKSKVEELLYAMGMKSPAWKYAGVFIAQEGPEDFIFDCENCSMFAIVGKLIQIKV